MIALDTNILARAIVNELEADTATQQQQQAAQALLASDGCTRVGMGSAGRL